MRYDACDWDDAKGANVDHVAEHDSPEEWQEVLDSADLADLEPSESDPDHWTYLGGTGRGRTLRIVFIMEDDGDFVYIRPITGYEPT
jgi:hypothetical protein